VNFIPASPFGVYGASPGDDRWTWSRPVCVPAAVKETALPGHQIWVEVACWARGCRWVCGRVETTVGGPVTNDPTLVSWIEGGQEGVTKPLKGRPDQLTEGYWVARFPLIRDCERAPDRIWFLLLCAIHGAVEIRSGALWAAITESTVRRPKRIGGIQQST